MLSQPEGHNTPPRKRATVTQTLIDHMLAILMHNVHVFGDLSERIKAEYLDEPQASRGLVWRIITGFYEEYHHLPTEEQVLAHVQDALQADPDLLNDSEIDDLNEFVEWVYDEDSFQRNPAEDQEYAEWARRLAKRFLEDQITRRMRDYLREQDAVPLDMRGLLAGFSEEAEEIATIGASSALPSLGNGWEEHLQRLEQHKGRDHLGLRTGLPFLDARTLGIRGTGVLVAMPGAGKTSLAAVRVPLGVCRYHEDNDAVAIVISLDMPAMDIMKRVHAHLAGLDWVRLVRGSPEDERAPDSWYSEADQEKLTRANELRQEWEVDQRLFIFDRLDVPKQMDAKSIERLVRRCKESAGATRALVVVDSLQKLPTPESMTRATDLEIEKWRIAQLKDVADRSKTSDNPLGDCVLAIAESRKPQTQGRAWAADMADVAGSARGAYDPDMVLVYRPMSQDELDRAGAQAGNPDQGVENVYINLVKGRDGMRRGPWAMRFQHAQSKFFESELPDSASDSIIATGDDDDVDMGAELAEINAPIPTEADDE